MLNIESVNHVGRRVTDKTISIDFYKNLDFEPLGNFGFEQGHSIIMKHASGVVVNLVVLREIRSKATFLWITTKNILAILV